MKRMTLLLLAASLLPSCVLAWNTPGEDFSGELKLGGPVTSTRNPWAWKVGEG
ncbi:fimbrial protein, partial [Salmonella enterica]